MASRSSDGDMTDAYYKEMGKISNTDWPEFARRCLRLEESLIDDIQHDYQTNVREQKFQMCKRWESSQKSPTAESFKQIVKHFLNSSSVERSLEERPVSVGHSIILVFHERLLPQVEKARKQLVDSEATIESIMLLSCNDERNYLPNLRSEIKKHTYRIFILTGIFETNYLNDFIPTLKEDCEKGNTVLVTRTSSSISQNIGNFTRMKLKRMHGDGLFHLISQFLRNNPKPPGPIPIATTNETCEKKLDIASEKQECSFEPSTFTTSDDFENCQNLVDESTNIFEPPAKDLEQKPDDSTSKFNSKPFGFSDVGRKAYVEATSEKRQFGFEKKDSQSSGDLKHFQKYEEELKRVEFSDSYKDEKHAHVLITSSLREQNEELQNIVRIPWIRVFDFDPKSRVLGFLSKVEEFLQTIRHFTITDRLDSVQQPDRHITNWVFANGYCDQADAEFLRDSNISENVIFKHCESLVKYCAVRKVPKVIILWYPDSSGSADKQNKGLDRLISCLNYHLKGQLGSFKCVICLKSKPHKHSVLGQMLKRLELENRVVVVPLEYLCVWIKENENYDKPTTESKTFPMILHVDREKGSYALSKKDDNWLSVCFDVVASNAEILKESPKHAEDFLKGGKLEWDVLATGKYDANRDILESTIEQVKKQFIETGKSVIIRIFHAPGGGGTTFARRVLWELRREAPCLELFSLDIDIEEVKNRLGFIRKETHLPVILLIDGNSSQDVKILLEYCRYEKVVILHVERFYSSVNRKSKAEVIWLPENVSKTEGQLLFHIFSRGKPEKKYALKQLTDEVETDKKHYLFEYGLTAFELEYHGLKSYVQGNLQISSHAPLANWHKALTYLSLAHYYGHCSLPSKLFTNLLQKSYDQIVLIEDLPHQAQKFLVENSHGEWKITYYIVAKEILEQLLVKRPQPAGGVGSKTLSRKACENLHEIAVEFIQFVRENVERLREDKLPDHVLHILTSVLIKRNYKDAGENDEFGNRSKYSRLVEDASSTDHRQKILEKLVEAFPCHAEFHAHLGRFYAITKQFASAEKCFEKAFLVRESERSDTNAADPVLRRIHGMYGFYLNEQVKNKINELRTHPSNEKVLTNILSNAKKAIHHFRQSKTHYQKGCNLTYVYMGEIKVRLHLAEIAIELSDGEIGKLCNEAGPLGSLAEFVLKSFSHCDELLALCIHSAEEHKIQDELNTCINKFNTFYKNAEEALKHWVGSDTTVYSKKCHVTILKMAMKKRNFSKFLIYEDVNDLRRLDQLIRLYEEIFQAAQKNSTEVHAVSNYMTEWLQAIRHPFLRDRVYTLANVHSRVKYWDAKNERGSLATFYHYVLTTLLAMNGPRGELTNKFSEESSRLKSKMKDCIIPLVLMERTSEWLIDHEDNQSFNNIIHRNLLGELDDRLLKKDQPLKVCKGKIKACGIWYGHIVLDGGQQPEVTLFFNPQRFSLSGSVEKQKRRVEFYVGFNPKHGAQAYRVSLLEKHKCIKCMTPTEISKLGRETAEWKGCCPKCGNEVFASASPVGT